MTEPGQHPADGALPVEDSFEALYNSAPCGFFSTTPDGEIISVNHTLSTWLTMPKDALIGRAFRQLLTPGSQLFYETRYLPVLRLTGDIKEVALTMLRPNGTELAVLVNSVVVADASGVPRLVRTAVFDSTARQDYERQLLSAQRSAELSESRVRILQEASAEFDASTTVEDLAEAFVGVARHAFSAPAVAVMLRDPSGELRLVAGSMAVEVSGPTDARPELDALAASQTVSLTTLDDALARYPSTGEAMSQARVQALWAIPLTAEGIGTGVLVCYFARERKIDDEVSLLLDTLAWQAMLVWGRIRLQAELKHLALHDPLTGLANRRLLQEYLAPTLAAAHRHGTSVAMIFIDLDGFKSVNDTLGHAIGDAILRAVAGRLCAAVRDDDIVGRLGGDEFLVICADTDIPTATVIAERVRIAVRAPGARVSPPTPITASIGVSVYRPRHGGRATGTDLIAAADSAMYESKKSGKDRVTLVQV
ncbi:diguanylate cyclase [Lacisediminihabitans sp. FW035]